MSKLTLGSVYETWQDFAAWFETLWNYSAMRADLYWPQCVALLLFGISYGAVKRRSVRMIARRAALKQVTK